MDDFLRLEKLFIHCRNSDISILFLDNEITQHDLKDITAVDIQPVISDESENTYIIYGNANDNKWFFCFANKIDDITYSCISDESCCFISTNRDEVKGCVQKITDFSWIIVIKNEVIFLKVDERIASNITRLQSLERTCFMSESFDLSEFEECFDESSMLSCNIDEEKRIFISIICGNKKLLFDFSLEESESEPKSDDEDNDNDDDDEEEKKIKVYGLPDKCVISSNKQSVIYSESNDYI